MAAWLGGHYAHRREGDTLTLQLSGPWTIATPPDVPDTAATPFDDDSIRTIAFDCSAIGDWDSALVVFALRLRAHCARRSIVLRDDGLIKAWQGLTTVEEVFRVAGT